MHTGVPDHTGNLSGTDHQGAEHARGKAGLPEHRLDGQGALRDIGGVLEQTGVARDQRGRGEAEDLPEREVPRHHGQYGPQRLVGHRLRPASLAIGSSARKDAPCSA